MINIIDCTIDEFKLRTQDKHIYMFGAGTRAKVFYKYLLRTSTIEGIIDNNDSLQGTKWDVDNQLEIFSMQMFINSIGNVDKSSIVIFITPIFGGLEIIKQLNEYDDELEGIECYVGSLLLMHNEKKKFSFSTGEPQIPKKIHYCWFGKTEIPKVLQNYMESWKKYCPDYEIIRWDESNYDISKNRYMYEAYQNRKWGFVPDYARLDIIYNEGGIYLDTDVELISNMDKLLCDKMFCGAMSEVSVAFGLGFGAVKGNELIRRCRDAYEDISFYGKNRELNLQPCGEYQAPVLEKMGFRITNEYQNIDGHVIYPLEE